MASLMLEVAVLRLHRALAVNLLSLSMLLRTATELSSVLAPPVLLHCKALPLHSRRREAAAVTTSVAATAERLSLEVRATAAAVSASATSACKVLGVATASAAATLDSLVTAPLIAMAAARLR
jgi:hypothetical protein